MTVVFSSCNVWIFIILMFFRRFVSLYPSYTHTHRIFFLFLLKPTLLLLTEQLAIDDDTDTIQTHDEDVHLFFFFFDFLIEKKNKIKWNETNKLIFSPPQSLYTCARVQFYFLNSFRFFASSWLFTKTCDNMSIVVF